MLKKIWVDLSTIKERDKFQYLQFKWLKKQNVIIDQEHKQAKKKCEEMEEKISTLNQEVYNHKWKSDHLCWQLKKAKWELENANQQLKNANQELKIPIRSSRMPTRSSKRPPPIPLLAL